MSVVIVAVSCGGCGQTTHYGHTERINAFPWNTKQSGDHMTARENNIAVYQLALEYLHAILPEGMKAADLDKYYIGDGRDYATLTDIFEQFIQSAQNYQGMPNYIKFSDRRAQIKEILFDFDIAQIADCDVEQLYRTFRKAFDVTSTDSIFNAWHKWSKSIVDVAKFMLDFRGAEDFRAFVDQFDYNPLMRTALPLLISTKISGFGFALKKHRGRITVFPCCHLVFLTVWSLLAPSMTILGQTRGTAGCYKTQYENMGDVLPCFQDFSRFWTDAQ